MTASVIISGSKLRKYIACERLPFMDHYADPAKAVEPARLLLPDLGVETELENAEIELEGFDHNEAGSRARSTEPRADSSDIGCPNAERGSTEPPVRAVTRPPPSVRGIDLIAWTSLQLREGAAVVVKSLFMCECLTREHRVQVGHAAAA